VDRTWTITGVANVRVHGFDEALPRARSLVGALEREPQLNPATGGREFALRDLDDLYVMVSSLAERR
jgi:hypothetical protein